MLNVKSLYTNIGSQFTPFVTLPTKKKNKHPSWALFAYPSPETKKKIHKKCVLTGDSKEMNKTTLSTPHLQFKTMPIATIKRK